MAHSLSRLLLPLLPLLVVVGWLLLGPCRFRCSPMIRWIAAVPAVIYARLDFRQAHLIGADFRGSDLRGADLREANLEGADLTGASAGRG